MAGKENLTLGKRRGEAQGQKDSGKAWVIEGHWTGLLGGSRLQTGWENTGEHEKGSGEQEGEPSPSWLLSVGFKGPGES